MVSMLQGVVDHGTASSVRALGVRGALGGKTGTTSDYRDAWFVGFSSAVVAGVWVGFDQPHAIRDGATGARVALPIWADFMRRTAQRLPSGPIAPPAGLRQAELCRLSHQRPVEGCDVYVEYFKDGDEMPSALCPIHPGTLRQRAARLVDGVVVSILRGLGLGR
jgi:membrane carboxypeptidase/penicillin-binding protein